MLRTLLVEDDPLFRGALADILATRFPGIVVDLAEDGAQALRQSEANGPRIIFLDITLPDADGFTIARDIRSLDRAVCIVMLGFGDTVEYSEAAHRAGADAYLCKGAADLTGDIIASVANIARRAVPPIG